MFQKFPWIVASIFTFLFVNASFGEAYWQQDIHTEMTIELRHPAQELHSHSKITYWNYSPDTLSEINMHLYPNAFQIGSVKYREYLGGQGSVWRAKMFRNGLKGYESKIDVSNFQIKMGDKDNLDTMQIDDTILKARLSKGLAPGDSITISLDWVHHVGKMAERAGFVEGQYNMAQWYPKMVVYDENGWHDDPFHASGEFYGEFGSFDVSLNLPASFIVGATGTLVSGNPGWESVRVDTSVDFDFWLESFNEKKEDADSSARREVRFTAKQVHDFAWVASPNFLYESGSVLGTDLHILYNASNGEDWTKKVLARSVRSVEWLSEKFGKYPYPQITVTDRLHSGGMEYPMLVMNGSEREGLIVHEIGHIWFYGILGNNEVDEAWLDEGFTTFQTAWYLQHFYKGGNDLSNESDWMKKYGKFTNRIHNDHWSIIRYILSGEDEPIARSSYLFNHSWGYGKNAYTKPAQMHRELYNLLGEETYLNGMQAYYDRWKLKHVNEARFRSVMEEVSGEDLDWFFDAWLHDTRILDYGIKSYTSKSRPDGTWDVTLLIEQKGERFMPLDILTKLKNGKSHHQRWENHLWRFNDTLRYQVPAKPINIILDPDVILLDVDRRNNFSKGMGTEWMFDIQNRSYNPMNKHVMKWLPTIHYNEIDGGIPGLHLNRSYGPYENIDAYFGFGMKSKQVYGSISGWRNAAKSASKLKWWGQVSKLPGVNEIQSNLNWDISSKNIFSLDQDLNIGFRVTEAHDSSRTDLFDLGTVALVYGKYGMGLGRNRVSFKFESTPETLSDWTFSRVSAQLRAGYSKGKIGLRTRVFAGKIWSENETVPSQEKFTIEGSGGLYEKSYLRDESSFFGFADLRNRYHLAGDGNLRGFLVNGSRLAGVEALVSSSVETYYQTGLDWLSGFNFEIAGFIDQGFFWGSKYVNSDKGFDGDLLADAGIGFRFKKHGFGRDFYFRIDFPFMIYQDDAINIDKQQWVFSFQKGI